MIIIADTSPVNYLILIGEIDVLPKLYESIIIPEAVRRELLAEPAPSLVREWALSPPAWLEIRQLTGPADGELSETLDAGESEAIQLATHLSAEILLIDELVGRRIAMERGIRVLGTIGVLIAAKRRNLIDADMAVAKLLKTNFHVSGKLIELLKSN